MSDEADIANDRILEDMERRIAAARQQPVEPGAEFCEECEADMPVVRRQMGAKLCVECQQRAEYQKKLFSR